MLFYYLNNEYLKYINNGDYILESQNDDTT